MRRLLGVAVFAVFAIMVIESSPALASDTLKFDPDHTSVTFRYPHFGLSHPSGKIMGASGTLLLDPQLPASSVLDVTLDLSTLTTALPAFDKVLKGSSYFDLDRFPQARFKSTRVEPIVDATAPDSIPKEAWVTGDLTLHGVTRSLVLRVTFNKKAFNPALFKTVYGFSASGHLSRKDFGLDTYEPLIGDDIDLVIDAELY